MDIPKFETKKELFVFLIENKETLTAQKKAVTKFSDGFAFDSDSIRVDADIALKAIKTNNPIIDAPAELSVKAVINTTNVIDSHNDVHLPGIWDKSLRENKNIMHLQEHKMQFDSIISDGRDLKVSAETKTWEELGFTFKGETQALIFDSTVKRSRNKYMHSQYADGHINNHSVAMQYVKIVLAINDEDAGNEFDVWEKYIDQIANKEEAISQGYFWAVKEAKVIEGSAVPIGSNQFTPTLENNKSKPVQATSTEPVRATQNNDILIHYLN